MQNSKETDNFRRMRLGVKVQRAPGLIASYQAAIGVYIQRLTNYHDLMGRIGERLGDPEPKELS